MLDFPGSRGRVVDEQPRHVITGARPIDSESIAIDSLCTKWLGS